MPPFRLELPDRRDERTNWRMLHTKKFYNLPVKVEDWDQSRDTKPYDNDPFCPGSVNLFKSHYSNLGFQENQPYITETMDMLEQVNKPENYSVVKTKKCMISYMSYQDWLPCEEKNDICPIICANDYLTTNQYSYTPPYPYTMNRLSCPSIPHLKYRRLKSERSELSPFKFYDEGFSDQTEMLQQFKSDRFKSYNPGTGLYSDGSKVQETQRKLFKLEYRKDE